MEVVSSLVKIDREADSIQNNEINKNVHNTLSFSIFNLSALNLINVLKLRRVDLYV